jgi:hypothetical protein
MMERRFEHRPALRIGVRVRDREGRVALSPTRNLTVNGAFIENGNGDFADQGVLWVDLPDPAAAGGWTNVVALVVHHRPDGVGVMFSRPYTALESLDPTLRRREAG